MALIACPNCGHEVDDSARRCPNCGHALRDDSVPSAAERTTAGSATETADVQTNDPRPEGASPDGEAPSHETVDDEERPAEAEPAEAPRGLAALQWPAVLGGFATILLAGILLPVILPLSATPLVAIAAGMLVTGAMARRAKFLNATATLVIYLIINLVLAFFIGAPPPAEGGGNGANPPAQEAPEAP